jgi:hypothetical protein
MRIEASSSNHHADMNVIVPENRAVDPCGGEARLFPA